MDLNNEDLELRLMNIQCCIGTLANSLLSKIKIGSSDIDCKLQELQVIERMYKYLKCYITEDAEVLATGYVEIDSVAIGDIIDVLINGESIIGGPRTANTTNVTTLSQGLVNLVNSSQNIYTATFTNARKGLVTIVGTCTNDVLTCTIEGNPDSTVITTGLSDGVCSINCLTEDQVKIMLDYIASKCKHCFALTI